MYLSVVWRKYFTCGNFLVLFQWEREEAARNLFFMEGTWLLRGSNIDDPSKVYTNTSIRTSLMRRSYHPQRNISRCCSLSTIRDESDTQASIAVSGGLRYERTAIAKK